MMGAREAVTRRYVAWLERRYPGTTWQPSSRDEIAPDRSHPATLDDLGGSLRTPKRTQPLGGGLSPSDSAPDENDREGSSDERP